MMIHTANIDHQHSVRVLIAISSICGPRIGSQDVSQVYLQSGANLLRDVYVKASDRFQLKRYQLLKLLKPFYGFTNADDYWYHVFYPHLRDDLVMVPNTGDVSLFIKIIRDNLCGMNTSYVDDTKGEKEFREVSMMMERMFTSSAWFYYDVTFVVIPISQAENGYKILQSHYLDQIYHLRQRTDYECFHSLRHKVA